MAINPTSDFFRLIPRDDEFLNRRTGSRGEIFFDRVNQTLRIFDGTQSGGVRLLTRSSADIRDGLANARVATVVYTVTIQGPQGGDTGNKYVLNGTYRLSPTFVTGYTYVFDQSDQTNVYFPNANGTTPNPHPLNFSADNLSGVRGGGTVYTTNVVYKLDGEVVSYQQYNGPRYNSATTRSVQITITNSTPALLYYWCYNHSAMGNSIDVSDPGSGGAVAAGTSISVGDSLPASPNNGNLWLNTNNGILYVYVNDGNSSQWIQPAAPISLDGITIDNATLTSAEAIGFNSGVSISEFSSDSTLADNSNAAIPTEAAVKTYVDTGLALKANLASPTFTGTVTGITAAMVGLGNVTNESKATMFTSPTFTGTTSFGLLTETLDTKTAATGTVVHNLSTGSIFYHSSISADFTANFTNVPTTDNRTIGVVLILDQGATAYIPTAVQIGGAAQTINWSGAAAPSGNANQIDIVSFSLIRTGASWIVIGALSTYG